MTQHQSGNVFFYIFIAIALFGSLTFAVSQSNRGSVQGLTRETARLNASEVIEYGETMARAVSTMRLRGVTLQQLRFAHDGSYVPDYGAVGVNPQNQLFENDGGAVIPREFSSEVSNSAPGQFMFNGLNEVEHVGSTCGDATCSELVAFLRDIRLEVCLAINDLLKIENPLGAPPLTTDSGATNSYLGTMSYTFTIGSDTTAAGLVGRNAGCFFDDDEKEYVFYRVLWAQ